MRSYKLDEFVAHSSNVNCLRIGRNTAGVLATGGEDKKVNLWRIGQPHVAKSLAGLQSAVECVTFDGGENQVAAGGANGTVKIWDLESGKVSRSLTGHRSNCLTLEFHPFGPFLATGSLDTNVKVWDLRRKDAITTFKGHTKGVRKVAISPDGKWVCSGSESGEVKLWDMQTGRVVKDNWCHEHTITGIEFHPYEFILATSSTDKTVKVWDLEVWEMVESLGPEATAIKAIAYHRDGKQLLTATADALKVWGCEPAVHHDTVPMNWRQLTDMHLSYKDDQPRVVGCCCNQSSVGVFLVDLRKVMPFCGHPNPPTEQALGVGLEGARPLQQPSQHRQGIGSCGRQRSEQLQPNQHNSSSHVAAGSIPDSQGTYRSIEPPGPAMDRLPPSKPSVGPLSSQRNRQHTPPNHFKNSSYIAGGAEQPVADDTVFKQQGGSAGAESSLMQHLQPGQLQPADGQQQVMRRRRTGDNFPELEIRMPAGPPPPRPVSDEVVPGRRNSSRSLGCNSVSSNTSSRRTSGYDADTLNLASAMQATSIGNIEQQQPHYAHPQRPVEQQPQQKMQQQRQAGGILNKIGSSTPPVATSPRDVHLAAEMPAAAAQHHVVAQGLDGLLGSCTNRVMSSVDGSTAAPTASLGSWLAGSGDPVVAAMAQRPLLKSELARMVTGLQLAKGFVGRGNLEGAYKAVVSQGDPAVACMVVEAVQERQDAFELNSVESLSKLLELLLASGIEQQQSVGLSALSLVLRGPGQMIRDVCNGPAPIGVDLSYEQRRNKCLLAKMALEGLGMKVGVLARGSGSVAARAQIVAEELKRTVT